MFKIAETLKGIRKNVFVLGVKMGTDTYFF